MKHKIKHNINKIMHNIKYNITFSGSTTMPDRAGENIAWYVLKCVRLKDGVKNTVHRKLQARRMH